MLPLDILERIWKDISIDFIEGLNKSAAYDTILVVVDCLSKYAHFLALKHPFTANTVVDQFIKDVTSWVPTLDCFDKGLKISYQFL